MLQAGEFNHGHIVAAGLQFQTTETVSEIFGEPVLKNSIFEDRLMQFIFNLTEEFMLAARNTENDSGAPLYSIDESVVGSCIAGMEGDYHVSMVIGIVGDIAHEKFELMVTKALSHAAA